MSDVTQARAEDEAPQSKHPGREGPSGSTERPVPGDAIDQFADGYFELDRDFRYRRVNVAGARLVRMSPDAILGHHVLALFPEVETTEVHQAVKRVMAGGCPEHIETYYAPLLLWAINSVYPLKDGVAIVSRDITAQKHLEQNLSFLAEASSVLSSSLDYERTLRTVAQLAVPHIADWCAVDMVNDAGAVERLAVAHVDPEKVRWAEDLRRREPVDLSAPTGLAKVIRTGQSEFYPEITDDMLVAAAKDEEHLALLRSIGFSSAMIVPLTVQGQTLGGITFVAAESGRHFAPAALAIAENLANRAALAVENARLYGQSQRAVALRDDFISVASHELKTPVTSLKIHAQLLQKQAERRGDESLARSVTKMNGQIDKLTQLIGDLLDVSRAESGHLALNLAAVDLDRLIAEVVESVQQTTDRHRIIVDGVIRRSLYADRERLGQVFTNLITNAVKYSPDADRVVVRLAAGEAGASIEVEDFGIGIAAEHHDKIFNRFYRVGSPDEKTFPGLGMGLYISHEIVRRHEGTLDVESATGSGSVFRVILPFGEEPGFVPDPEEVV